MQKVRLSAATERFLAWASSNLRPATVAVYRLYLQRFRDDVGDVDLRSLTPAKLTTWSQRFHPVQSVQRLVSWCHRYERSLRFNPLEGMRKPASGRRLRTLTAGESAALLRGSDRVFRPFLIALRETWARPQEMRAVRPCDIRQLGGGAADVGAIAAGKAFFEMASGKGFERRSDRTALRIIPISPRLGRLVVRRLNHGVRFDGPLFVDRRGRPWTANAVRCRLRRLRSRIGMNADHRGERVVAYTFRHSGATAAAAAGLRDFRLAEVLGHASTRTTARYVHLSAVDLLDAVGQVWEAKTRSRAKIDRLASLRPRSD